MLLFDCNESEFAIMSGVNHCFTLAVKIEVFLSYNLLAGCFSGAFGFSTF